MAENVSNPPESEKSYLYASPERIAHIRESIARIKEHYDATGELTATQLMLLEIYNAELMDYDRYIAEQQAAA